MVEVKGEIPLIHPDDPDSKKVRERMVAKARVFNLSDDADLREYERVWQLCGDGLAKMGEPRLEPQWDAVNCRFTAFVRWYEIEFVAPGETPPV